MKIFSVYHIFFSCSLVLGMGVAAPLAWCASGTETQVYEKLKPLHEAKRPPGPMDWLAQHDEPGQSFEEFVRSNPLRPTAQRHTIYVTLLGDFDPVRREIIEKTVEYMRAFFGLPVKFADPIPLSEIPQSARRVHPLTGDKQILSTYVMQKILIPRKPDDAVCLIAFSSSDLWPGAGWNFVFGQASILDGVAVWSIYRNGDPSLRQAAYQLCLRRTIKTGVHETAHMFGLHHCVDFECVMNGSNHRRESDARPMWLDPECLHKLCWVLGLDPVKRYQNLLEVSERLDLDKEAAFFKKSLEVIQK